MIKNKNNINIVSYNICWEAMKGVNLNHKNYSTNGDNIRTIQQRRNLLTTTRHNLLRYLKARSNSDFILIQEAEGIRELLRQFSKSFKPIYHKSGLDKMCLLYDKHKYNPIKSKIIKAEFEKGRPYLIVPFKGGKCVINVHFPHTKHLKNKMMKGGNSKISLDQCMKKIERDLAQMSRTIPNFHKYQIIIGGDFNTHIPSSYNFSFNGKKIKMNRYRPAKPTCCYLNSDKISYKWYLDQFYINKKKTKKDKCKVDFPIRPLSDHLPIHLELCGKSV